MYWPKQLSGEIELTAATTPESTTPCTSRTIMVHAAGKDRWSRENRNPVNEKGPLMMKWY